MGEQYVGLSPSFVEDEIMLLDIPDGYDFLPYKTKAILDFSVSIGAEFTFLCDVDTFLIYSKLVRSGYDNYDYFGVNTRIWGQPFIYNAVDRHGQDHFIANCLPWHSGGFGYFVSRRAAEYVITQEPMSWAEDLFVGNVLGKEGSFKMGNMAREISTWHAPRGLAPQGVQKWLKDMYEEHGA